MLEVGSVSDGRLLLRIEPKRDEFHLSVLMSHSLWQIEYRAWQEQEDAGQSDGFKMPGFTLWVLTLWVLTLWVLTLWVQSKA